MLRSILSNPSLSPYSSSLATLLVMGVVCLVRARFSRSIHSHFKHSCWQKLIVKERGCRRQTRYMSDIPKAPGLLCCCRMLNRDLNSDLTPVSSKTSRTAVSAISSRLSQQVCSLLEIVAWFSHMYLASSALSSAHSSSWKRLQHGVSSDASVFQKARELCSLKHEGISIVPSLQ